MRITITCEDCGRRHRLARTVADPGEIWIVCHECETPLRALLELPRQSVEATASLSPTFTSAWGGTLDLAER